MKEYFEKVYSGSEKEFHKLVHENIKSENKMFIVTANPETIMTAEENEEFKKCLMDEKTVIVPDGIGVVKGARMCGFDIKETITGIELVKKVFQICNDDKKKIFLFGAKNEVIEKMKEKLANDYPNMEVVGMCDGYVEDKQSIYDTIVELKPDVTLVAMGIPNQELLIYNNLDRFDKGIFIGVGGSFDVISGCKKRAPKIFIKFHLEWLYRILREPKRLKRFFKSNVKYLLKIRKERVKVEKND